ncbi:MAG TPA: HD domain-containing protein [Longimicrobiales bacterium]|nr:HD domain-containing protein [Longimicrobiales bacterium]
MPLATPTPGPTPTIRGLPRPLARAMEACADRLDVDKIREAHDFAVEAHAGQRRASGEEYVSHTVEVATILATLRLDAPRAAPPPNLWTTLRPSISWV